MSVGVSWRPGRRTPRPWRERLLELPGVGLHASEGGKLVVTVEDTPETMAADTLAALGHVPGVLNTSLIYHYGGDEPLEDGEREHQSA